MSGTLLVTGANSSLALPAIKYLLSTYPSYVLVLTVRNASPTDKNTEQLRATIAQFPQSKTSIRVLDLASLSAVSTFATQLNFQISSSTIPKIKAVICNAFAWSISTGLRFTTDDHELSMGVNHIAHFSLILRLLGSFQPDGRVVFLGSGSIEKSPLEKYPPRIPEDLETLVKLENDVVGEEVGRGFWRYAVSKLVVVMVMWELNRRLSLDPNLKSITAVAINPGDMPDSRCMNDGVPKAWQYGTTLVAPLLPVLKYVMPNMRSVYQGGLDLIELAVGENFKEKTGYFEGLKEVKGPSESRDERKQKALWTKSLKWAKVGREDTVLKSAFDSE